MPDIRHSPTPIEKEVAKDLGARIATAAKALEAGGITGNNAAQFLCNSLLSHASALALHGYGDATQARDYLIRLTDFHIGQQVDRANAAAEGKTDGE